MADSQRWCKLGYDQKLCVQAHARDIYPHARPRNGQDRQCPVCSAPLSLNPGTKGMWLVWTCHGGCRPEVVRAALEERIDLGCLGAWYSDEWLARKSGQPTAVYPARDPATERAARRWYAAQKLIGQKITNASLLRMCMQAIAEGDGEVPGDWRALLPTTRAEFVALAKRAGIEKPHRHVLATNWFSKATT